MCCVLCVCVYVCVCCNIFFSNIHKVPIWHSSFLQSVILAPCIFTKCHFGTLHFSQGANSVYKVLGHPNWVPKKHSCVVRAVCDVCCVFVFCKCTSCVNLCVAVRACVVYVYCVVLCVHYEFLYCMWPGYCMRCDVYCVLYSKMFN